MSTLTTSAGPVQMVRGLLQSLQRRDRETIVLGLVELGLWVTVTTDPLPLPDVSVVSSAALTITLDELRSTIRQYRIMSANITDRDTNPAAAALERNAEMMERVAAALSALTPTTGFLMVEG